MNERNRLLFYVVESSLHAGLGNSLGRVDMIIQRERYTRFPIIEASSLKGVFRSAFDKRMSKDDPENNVVSILFGPEKGDEYSGSLIMSNANILLFPIKSMKNVYALATCPSALLRFNEYLQKVGKKPLKIPKPNTVPENTNLIILENKIVLEEFTFEISESDACSTLAEFLAEYIIGDDEDYAYLKEKIENDLVILSDDDFSYFVQYSTELHTRTKIDPATGTVQHTGLFTEEYLPADTVLYSLVSISKIYADGKHIFSDTDKDAESKKALNYFIEHLPKAIQIGKNGSIGKGIVKIFGGN